MSQKSVKAAPNTTTNARHAPVMTKTSAAPKVFDFRVPLAHLRKQQGGNGQTIKFAK